MRKFVLVAVISTSQLVGAADQGKARHELNQWNPINGEYKIHSGGTAYSEPPTKGDSAFSFYFKGEAAKQMFDQMGPDVQNVCGGEPGDRKRQKKGALCLYETRLDDPNDSHYRCWVGINLRTGQGDVRVSC